MSPKCLITFTLLVHCLRMTTSAAFAANVYWDDAGGSASKLWSDFGNWNPDGSVSLDDVFVGVDPLGANVAAAANDRTLFDGGISITSLTVGNGADVVNSTDEGATNDYELIVNGNTTIRDAGSSIVIYGGDPDGLDTNNLTITDGGALILNSTTAQGTAVVEIDGNSGVGLLDVDSGGLLTGAGRIDLEASPSSATVLIRNDGEIVANTTPGLIFLAPAAGTLQITATSVNALFDWDGTSSNGVLRANGNQTLDIDVSPGTDGFGGEMFLSTGSTIDVAHAWELDTGVINANTPAFGFIIIGQDPNPGPAARIAGANWQMTGGTINVDDSWDSLQFDSQLLASAGVINNEGTMIFNGGATILSGVDFNMIGPSASLIVNSTLNIDTPDFNLDGDGLAGNVTTINVGGNLDLDLGAGADDIFNHTINLNGGELDVTTSDNNWGLSSSGAINAGGAILSFINGDTFQTAGGTINVAANSRLNFGAVADINGPAAISIAAGGTLDFTTAIYGSNAATISGAGILRKGLASIDADTTWNVATVDLDDGNTTLNANLTINTDAIDDTGDGADLLIVVNDPYTLTVNITGGGKWTLDPAGQITYNGNASVNSYLAGSDLQVDGTFNHSGDGRVDARLDIGSTGVININTAGEPLRLSGGNMTANPNTIAGGVVTGVGVLGADGGSALHGFGTIDTDVDFDASANLKADNGVLTINGAILDANVIGTADSDGILNVTNAWNTNAVASVDLEGGELRGAAITNDGGGGINGHGLVSARVVNNSRIDAKNNDTLVVQTSLNNNDWDGSANAGRLNAVAGNLEIRDVSSFLFNGTVNVGANRTFFANGFELEFDPASTLSLTEGTYRSTAATDIGGTVAVNAGGPSRLRSDLRMTFESGSTTSLAGDLRLESPVTVIQVDAAFSGGGALINASGRTLQILDGVASADLAVLVQNEGTLVLGSSAGQAQGGDFQQLSTGVWDVELGGTGLNDFDRFNLTGAAQLAGTLNLSLINGYVPTLGDSLSILSATGGVAGAFDAVVQPATMPAGLMFDVIYNPTLVQLQVVSALAFTADFDMDGDVDGGDLAQWQGDMGDNGDSDADGDGDSDGADFLAWQQQFGSGVPATAAAASIPEPSSLGLLVALIVAAPLGRRRLSHRVGWKQQTN